MPGILARNPRLESSSVIAKRQSEAQRRGVGPEGDRLHGRVCEGRQVVEMAPP